MPDAAGGEGSHGAAKLDGVIHRYRVYLHDHFPQLAESFSAMYIRNVSRQSGLDLLSHFQQRYSERLKFP